jgi:hypothetical protein
MGGCQWSTWKRRRVLEIAKVVDGSGRFSREVT